MNKPEPYPTAYRMELKERILKTAMLEFSRKGIRAVKMDDIAHLLSISKRTLYELYSNKEELLMAGLKRRDLEYSAYMEQFSQDGTHSVMDILLEFYRKQMEELAGITPIFFIEMAKYKPIRDYIQDSKERRRHRSCVFFECGVQEGWFRPDVDYDIVEQIGRASMEYIMHAEMYLKYNFNYIFRNILFLLLRGFCTQKGLDQIDTFLKQHVPN